MGNLIRDSLVSAFIWALLYFMFQPVQGILNRAQESRSNALELFVFGGFIATVLIDWSLRRRALRRLREKSRESASL